MCNCKAIGAGADNYDTVIDSVCIIYGLHLVVTVRMVTEVGMLGEM